MGKATFYIVTGAIFWLIVCAIWPYWDRYWIESDVRTVAVYGTKHSIRETREFLKEKFKERGDDFNQESFHIEKDDNNTVSIRITYPDKISFLGLTLKELEFTVEATERETMAVL